MKDPSQNSETRRNILGYEIRIQGALDPRWSDWFHTIEMEVIFTSEQFPVTTIRCPTADQAQLRGILNKVWDLNLRVLSVQTLDPPGPQV